MSARANSSKSYSSKNNKENTIVPWCSAPRHSDPILATPARVFWMKASPHHCQRALWPGTGRLHTLSSRGDEPPAGPQERTQGGQGPASPTQRFGGMVDGCLSSWPFKTEAGRLESSRRKLPRWLWSAVSNNLACDLSSSTKGKKVTCST